MYPATNDTSYYAFEQKGFKLPVPDLMHFTGVKL